MNKLFLSLLFFSFSLTAMQKNKSIERDYTVNLSRQNEQYTVSLETIMPHLLGYQIVVDAETGEESLSGFHAYKVNQDQIRKSDTSTILEVTDYLWIYTEESPKAFHEGYLIYKGQYINLPKTFFPLGWSRKDIVEYIASRLSHGTFSWTEEPSGPFKILKAKVSFEAQTPLCVVLKKYQYSCVLKTIYPECRTALTVDQEQRLKKVLEGLAQEQAKRLTALRQERLSRALKAAQPKPQEAAQRQASHASALIAAVESSDNRVVARLLNDGTDVHVRDGEGKTPLMIAAAQGNLELCADLLNYGAHTADKDDKGKSVLDYALSACDDYIVRSILTPDVIKELNSLNRTGTTPLIRIIKTLQEKRKDFNPLVLVDLAEQLLSVGVDPNKADADKLTPLMHCVRLIKPKEKELEVAQLLLELLLSYGADPDLPREVSGKDRGRTALMYAAEYGHEQLVAQLLEAQADYELHNVHGKKKKTALSIAENKRYEAIVAQIKKHISEKQKWITEKNANELIYAAYKNCTRKVLKVLGLIDSGTIKCDVNHSGYGKDSALYHAVAHNNRDIVQALLARQADPRRECPSGQTIVAYAQTTSTVSQEIKDLVTERAEELNADIKEAQALKERRKKQAVETFMRELEEGTLSQRTVDFLKSIKPCLIDGHSPVAHALRARRPKLVTALCRHKTLYEDENDDLVVLAYDSRDLALLKAVIKSEYAKESQLKKLCRVAVRTHRSDILFLLKEVRNFYATVFRDLIQENDAASAEKLCQFSAELLTDEQAGESMIQALRLGRSAFAELLVKRYPSVVFYNDEHRMTALMYAAQQSNVQLFETLCRAGADLNARDSQEHTVQSFIAQNSPRTKVFFDLIERYLNNVTAAEPSSSSERRTLLAQGWTEAMVAVYQDNREVLEGCSITDLNKSGCDGMCPLHVAVIHTKKRCFDYLVGRAGIALNAVDSKGKTALIYAAGGGNSKMVTRLLERGASVLIFDNEGKIALHRVQENENSKKIASQIARVLFEEITQKALLGEIQDLPALLQQFKFSDEECIGIYCSIIMRSSAHDLDRLISSSPSLKEAMKKSLGEHLKMAVAEYFNFKIKRKSQVQVNSEDRDRFLGAVKNVAKTLFKDQLAQSNELIDKMMNAASKSVISKNDVEPTDSTVPEEIFMTRYYLFEGALLLIKINAERLNVLLKHELVDPQRLMFWAVIFEVKEALDLLIKRFPTECVSWQLTDVPAELLAGFILESSDHEWYHPSARKGVIPTVTPSILAWILNKKRVLKELFRCSAPDLLSIVEPRGWPVWLYIFTTPERTQEKTFAEEIQTWFTSEGKHKMIHYPTLLHLASEGFAMARLWKEGVDLTKAGEIITAFIRASVDYKNRDYLCSRTQDEVESRCIMQLQQFSEYRLPFNMHVDGMHVAEYALRHGFLSLAIFLLPHCDPATLSDDACDLLLRKVPLPDLLRTMKSASLWPAKLLWPACIAGNTDVIEIVVNSAQINDDAIMTTLAYACHNNLQARVIKALIGRRKVSHLADSPSGKRGAYCCD